MGLTPALPGGCLVGPLKEKEGKNTSISENKSQKTWRRATSSRRDGHLFGVVRGLGLHRRRRRRRWTGPSSVGIGSTATCSTTSKCEKDRRRSVAASASGHLPKEIDGAKQSCDGTKLLLRLKLQLEHKGSELASLTPSRPREASTKPCTTSLGLSECSAPPLSL